MSVENISTLVYKNKKRSVDTLYQIVYNKSSDELVGLRLKKFLVLKRRPHYRIRLIV